MKTRRKSEKLLWVSIVGARPQFVKLGPICRAIEQHNREISGCAIHHQILNTGQHYDREVSGLLFEELNIPEPNYNLRVGSGSHGTQIARMLGRMEPILCALQPDWIIVYGDTNSTLAGALLAARLEIPLAHVEAGCRSAQIAQPEEQNRIVADQLSQLLLPVSELTAANLYREGIGVAGDPLHRRVVIAGDVQYDAVLQNSGLARELVQGQLNEFDLKSHNYYLLTLHRAENTNDIDRLRALLQTASGLDLPVLFPIHPRTKDILTKNGVSLNGNIRTAPPQGYLEMLALEMHAHKILTDSGGVQKEAFYLNVPCVTLRERTEWLETISLGANCLAGYDPSSIRNAALANSTPSWTDSKPYGDGSAAKKIVAELVAMSSSPANAPPAQLLTSARSA